MFIRYAQFVKANVYINQKFMYSILDFQEKHKPDIFSETY